jgi:hypothetical protein
VVAVPDKNGNLNVGEPIESLILHELIHYHILPPNEPHSCEKYGCPGEAKYKLGNSYYFDHKTISHFKEIAKKCQEEGFELIEDTKT